MNDFTEKMKEKTHDTENKMHEMKGRAQQKLDGDDEDTSTE